MDDWISHETYWVNTQPQCSPRWHDLHVGRATASLVGGMVGHNHFRLEAATMDLILGKKPHPEGIPLENKMLMEEGVLKEPVARAWYAKTYRRTVSQIGIAIPKWDLRLGASPDGVLEDGQGIIEIKIPKKIYRPLVQHLEKIAAGWKPPPGYHRHIWDSHYDQMITTMAVMGKSYCDYIVFSPSEGKVFTERVLFNKEYWEGELYPGIKRVLEKYGEELSKCPRVDPGKEVSAVAA